jgi:hypothetical protein
MARKQRKSRLMFEMDTLATSWKIFLGLRLVERKQIETCSNPSERW